MRTIALLLLLGSVTPAMSQSNECPNPPVGNAIKIARLNAMIDGANNNIAVAESRASDPTNPHPAVMQKYLTMTRSGMASTIEDLKSRIAELCR